jgi:DNA-binding MarR family transcriptional regulator
MAKLRKGGFLLSKVHRLSGRVFARLLKNHGLQEINPAQGRILFVLWDADEIPIHELARRTSLGKSTISTMLDRLVIDGFVARRTDPDNRRTVLVRSTVKDEAIRRTFVAVSEEMTKLWYRGLSEGSRDQFEAVLAHILDNLESAECNRR